MSASEDASNMMCPGCGAHLGDTWDYETDECRKCGFEFDQELYSDGSGDPLDYGGSDQLTQRREDVYLQMRRRRRRALVAVLRFQAGPLSLVFAVFAGGFIANADFVQTVNSAQGSAISIGTPGAAFWGGVVCLMVATVLHAFAVSGGESA